jgi:hypothetical protein
VCQCSGTHFAGIWGSPANRQLHLDLVSESSSQPGPLQLHRLVPDSDYFSRAMPDPSRTMGVVRFGPCEADFAGAEPRRKGCGLSSKTARLTSFGFFSNGLAQFNEPRALRDANYSLWKTMIKPPGNVLEFLG